MTQVRQNGEEYPLTVNRSEDLFLLEPSDWKHTAPSANEWFTMLHRFPFQRLDSNRAISHVAMDFDPRWSFNVSEKDWLELFNESSPRGVLPMRS